MEWRKSNNGGKMKNMECPYCGTRIDKILIIEEGSYLWEPELNEEGKIIWATGEFQTSDIYQVCPECGAKLCDYDEEKIIKMLKRRKNEKAD